MNMVKSEVIQLLRGGWCTALFFFLQGIYFQLTFLNIMKMFMFSSFLDIKTTYVAYTCMFMYATCSLEPM